MKLIIFSTAKEADASLKRFKATPYQDSHTYRFHQGIIVIGGMGLLAAAHATSRYIEQVDEVWNLGVAGTLQQNHRLGDVFTVNTVSRRAPTALDDHASQMHQRLFPLLTLRNSGERLVTSDVPIHDRNMKASLSQYGDLVDMEGYAIAYIAQRWNRPCSIWKVVSDFASEGGPQLIQQQLDSASIKIADLLEDLL